MAENPNAASPDLLEKYRSFGEDHPLYRKLSEALAHGQNGEMQAAVAELEATRQPDAIQTAGARSSRSRCILWILVLGGILGIGLGSTGLCYVTRHAQDIRNRHPVMLKTASFMAGAELGGYEPQDLTLEILRELDRLQPDNCLFVGHQLAKKELVEYLSALSRHHRAIVALGPNSQGRNQLAGQGSPLRNYEFTGLMEIKIPVRTQVLLAFNNQTRQAIAFLGTYPFDVQDASESEHSLVVIRDFEQCSEIYRQYATFLSQRGRAIR